MINAHLSNALECCGNIDSIERVYVALHYCKDAWYADLRSQQRVHFTADDIVVRTLPKLLWVSLSLDAPGWP